MFQNGLAQHCLSKLSWVGFAENGMPDLDPWKQPFGVTGTVSYAPESGGETWNFSSGVQISLRRTGL